ncbi:MAG: hypothetical protein ACYCVY_04565 [Acidiferrobacteraceae bacterium]|jgi:hypothetical protein
MNKRAIFPASVLMSFVAFGLVTALYLAPALGAMSDRDALTALVMIHAYRFIGLAFLIPGVVAEGLPPEFARPAAYGDLIAAILAVLSVLMLHEHTPGAFVLTWVFNVWGTGDLLNAMFQGVRRVGTHPKGPGLLGAAFFIPTVIVPALLITHGLIFWLLLRTTH